MIPFFMAWNAPTDMGSDTYSPMSFPIDMDITSTPSCMAASKAARMSISAHAVRCQHTLYMATLAEGTAPLDVPLPNPKRLAFGTRFPAKIDDVCVPWPFVSMGDRMSSGSGLPSSLKYLAPISLL